MYTFSKWLTQADQVELVQKDMESAKRFACKRNKLSGLEQEPGILVVGVTALTFLNLNEQICFVHPYQILGRYQGSDADARQFEYSLDSKHKNARYVFTMEEEGKVAEVVAEVDRRSLRLEKSLVSSSSSSGGGGGGGGAPKSPRGGGMPKSPRGGGKSPRGGAPMFDPEVQAATTAAAPKKTSHKVTQVSGVLLVTNIASLERKLGKGHRAFSRSMAQKD